MSEMPSVPDHYIPVGQRLWRITVFVDLYLRTHYRMIIDLTTVVAEEPKVALPVVIAGCRTIVRARDDCVAPA